MPDPVIPAPVAATPIPAAPAATTSTAAPSSSPVTTAVETPVSADPTPPVETGEKPEAPTPPEPPATSLLATAEAKKTEEKTEEAKPKPQEAEKPAPVESAPIEYQPFKLPDGFEVDTKDMDEFRTVLGEHKAPQELGQKIIDLYTKELQKVADAQKADWQKTLDTWKNDVLADPELGGNRINTVLQQCGSVLEQFGSPQLRKMLEVSGMGNNIEMVRFVHKVAQFVNEPKQVLGTNPVPDAKPSRAQRRYGKANGAAASP